MTMAAASDVHACEELLGTIALVKSMIEHDDEADELILKHADPDLQREWLSILAKILFLDAFDDDAEAALAHLDRMTADGFAHYCSLVKLAVESPT
jgi:hypothetical protein